MSLGVPPCADCPGGCFDSARGECSCKQLPNDLGDCFGSLWQIIALVSPADQASALAGAKGKTQEVVDQEYGPQVRLLYLHRY